MLVNIIKIAMSIAHMVHDMHDLEADSRALAHMMESITAVLERAKASGGEVLARVTTQLQARQMLALVCAGMYVMVPSFFLCAHAFA